MSQRIKTFPSTSQIFTARGHSAITHQSTHTAKTKGSKMKYVAHHCFMQYSDDEDDTFLFNYFR